MDAERGPAAADLHPAAGEDAPGAVDRRHQVLPGLGCKLSTGLTFTAAVVAAENGSSYQEGP